ncbi:MAG: hypothetical protein C0504_13995 [Candidatus Solibacter sp.]|nr:hypothetical protein [Candidatus Solibacter sp.]
MFSTNLTLNGEDRNDDSKLIEADATGKLRTYLSVKPEWFSGGRHPLNFPSLRAPILSSDGQTVAWTATRTCIGGSGCLAVARYIGHVLHGRCSAGERCETSSDGWARLSPNGRYAAFANPSYMLFPRYALRLVDLETGTFIDSNTRLTGLAESGGSAIANDGTIVSGALEPGITVYAPGLAPRIIPTPWNLTSVTVSPDGRFAVGQTQHEAPTLVIVELATGWYAPYIEAVEGATRPAFTDDGQTLMFLSGANWEDRNVTLAVQVWSIDLPTGILRQWTSAPSGIRDAAISGNGQVVIAATADGRLLSIDSLTLESTELARAAEASTDISGPAARLSRYSLTGTGLDRVKLTFKGQPVDVLTQSPSLIEFIFPATSELGGGPLELSVEASPFQSQNITVELKEAFPEFIIESNRASGLRADGSPISESNPVQPGETITLHMRGLGPVDFSGNVMTQLELVDATTATITFPPIEILSATADPAAPGLYLLKARVPNRTYTQSPVYWYIRLAGDEYFRAMAFIPVQTQ